MKRVLTAAVSLCFISILHAQVDAKLADAVKHAKVSLDAGLKASEREGKPISGKFELDEGKLQLSVYTEKARKFYEVVVDHTSGKIAKTEEITSQVAETWSRISDLQRKQDRPSLRDARMRRAIVNLLAAMRAAYAAEAMRYGILSAKKGIKEQKENL